MLKQAFFSFLTALGLSSAEAHADTHHPFEAFLASFIPEVAEKATQLNKAFWLLETTGSEDAASLVASLTSELSLLFHSDTTYNKLIEWQKDPEITDPLTQRQLQTLIFSFKANAAPEEWLKDIAEKEAKLSLAYANFRSTLEGKEQTENDIIEILKSEKDPSLRKKAWNASKEIGKVLAPQILDIVRLRNQVAHFLGYKSYFDMQLDLQEVEQESLFTLLNDVASQSDIAYEATLIDIHRELSSVYNTPSDQLGPWAWNDPFSQEDPMDKLELDSLVANADIVEATRVFYQNMGIDVDPILERSDLYERKGKNQHAFCINMDRKNDIRTLNNIKANLRWFDTLLHELGHAIYELGYDKSLPWQLKEPPHMIPTEAMALLAGRRAYMSSTLKSLPTYDPSQDPLIEKAEQSMKRRQLIFSRWAIVMTYFEKELYRNPEQDLNALWWDLVAKYQKIPKPEGRENAEDWAAKYHVGLAPVYYYSYLLGELFASEIEQTLFKEMGSFNLSSEKAGKLLNERLFAPGNSMTWSALIEHVIGKPLSAEAWIAQFAKE